MVVIAVPWVEIMVVGSGGIVVPIVWDLFSVQVGRLLSFMGLSNMLLGFCQHYWLILQSTLMQDLALNFTQNSCF